MVEMSVHNSLGKQVGILVSEIQNPGSYEVEFDALELNSGVYFYSLSVNGEKIETKRMLLLK